jgi:lysophospholipase L1-like esterase
MRWIKLAGLVILALTLLGGGGQAARAEQLVPLKIMPLGDSITCALEFQASYRYYLWHRLLNAGYAVDFVGSLEGVFNGHDPLYPDFDWDHEGHSGYRAQDVLPEVKAWAQAAQPDVVLIHLGTVDMFEQESISYTLAALGGIIDKLREVNPNVKILLAQIIPTRDAEVRAQIQLLNAQIPVLVKEKNSAASPVRTVNQYTGFNPWSDTVDGVHPNGSGEQKLGDNWYTVFRVLMNGRPRVYLPLMMMEP